MVRVDSIESVELKTLRDVLRHAETIKEIIRDLARTSGTWAKIAYPKTHVEKKLVTLK